MITCFLQTKLNFTAKYTTTIWSDLPGYVFVARHAQNWNKIQLVTLHEAVRVVPSPAQRRDASKNWLKTSNKKFCQRQSKNPYIYTAEKAVLVHRSWKAIIAAQPKQVFHPGANQRTTSTQSGELSPPIETLPHQKPIFWAMQNHGKSNVTRGNRGKCECEKTLLLCVKSTPFAKWIPADHAEKFIQHEGISFFLPKCQTIWETKFWKKIWAFKLKCPTLSFLFVSSWVSNEKTWTIAVENHHFGQIIKTTYLHCELGWNGICRIILFVHQRIWKKTSSSSSCWFLTAQLTLQHARGIVEKETPVNYTRCKPKRSQPPLISCDVDQAEICTKVFRVHASTVRVVTCLVHQLAGFISTLDL